MNTTIQHYSEIFKLREMIDNAKIPYRWDAVVWENEQGQFVLGYHLIAAQVSVVENCHSYGNDEDLLEIMGGLTEAESEYDDVLGWLSAKEVFARIMCCYKNSTNVFVA